MKELKRVLEERNINIEFEVYNYTTGYGCLMTRVEELERYMENHKNHEWNIDSIIMDDTDVNPYFEIEELVKIAKSRHIGGVMKVMEMNGVDLDRAIELIDNSIIYEGYSKEGAFREYYEVVYSEEYKLITSLNLVPGISGFEIYIDWDKVMNDMELNQNIEIFEVSNDVIIL